MKDKLKVLVVDDDRRMVKTICDILKVRGHESIAAHSGEAATDKIIPEYASRLPRFQSARLYLPVHTVRKIALGHRHSHSAPFLQTSYGSKGLLIFNEIFA